jgi:diguanylate cyclase (GGDEF)-like protein
MVKSSNYTGLALRQLCCVVILGATLLPATAQPKPVRFTNIGLRDGLANASVSSMVQDAAGFIWIGTQGGLHRWDGHSFQLYENEPFIPNSLPHNLIQTMFMDPDGHTIWIGTYGGLTRFDTMTQKFQSWSKNPDDPASLPHNVVVAIAKDADGRLWVGTLDGLCRMDGDSFIHYRADPDNPQAIGTNVIRALFLDSRAILWIGTSGGGLQQYRQEHDDFRRLTADRKTVAADGSAIPDGHSLGSDYVMSISEAADGNLWLGQWFFGVSRYDPEQDLLEHFPLADERVYFVNATEQGRIYAGTWGGGLFELILADGSIRRHVRGERMWTLPHDTVYSCLVDQRGEVWIGTNGGGFSHLHRESDWYTVYEHDPTDPGSRAPGKTLSVLLDRQDRLWVGTYNGGLSRLDPGTSDFKHFRHSRNDPQTIPNDIVTKLYEDSNGTIWAMTNGGIAWFDENSAVFRRIVKDAARADSLPDNIVYDMIEEPGTGNFWIAMYTGGLAYWDRTQDSFTQYLSSGIDRNSLSDNLVYALAYDHQDRLWIATNAGLNRYEGNGRFQRYFPDPDDPSSLPSGIIRDLAVDDDGVLWIATNGGGVARYLPDSDSFRHWTKRHGLPSNVVVAIVHGPNGTVWVSTATGLGIYDPVTDLFRPFSSQGELRYGEFGTGRYRSSSGHLYFGALNTLYRINPTTLDSSIPAPPVRITGISILNVPLDTNVSPWFIEDIELAWNRSSISFTFSALDYSDPGRNQYAYQLEGFDADWISSGSRAYANYTNLPSGREYLFRVRASSQGGVWNQAGTVIRLRINPAPWLTWWAFALYLLVLAGLVWTVTVFRSRFLLRGKVSELTRLKGELEEANARLGILADHDGLTGLLNRRSLERELERRFEAAASLGEPVSALMIDIDRFKNFNDHYGHQMGDECLIQVAQTIAGTLERSQDSVTRYGGEEFLVLLPATDLRGARNVAERIIRAIQALAIPHAASDVAMIVTVSIGAGTLIPGPQHLPGSIVEMADSMLYRAKQAGRNRIVSV